MRILYSALHNLDMNQDKPIRKKIPSDFGSFILSYIDFATSLKSAYREYAVRDQDRTVVSCICELFIEGLKQGDMILKT